ncbi:hypothetical protein HAX54_043503 [Datura stramonium]|uniref:Uncharacterized protein n=1 Tax=Datura stramonium TaxID=4076 RepID=A0ABS8SNP2_DATST|nr:hypothetical protein [Datura stramonium]
MRFAAVILQDKDCFIEDRFSLEYLPDSDVNIHKAEYGKDECIYCNYCSAFIVDFHRSCSSCSYDLCLTCCKELRNGNSKADASEVRMQYIDNGPGYLHVVIAYFIQEWKLRWNYSKLK